MPFLCRLGFHRWHPNHVFKPSIYAEIVTEYRFASVCLRCGKEVVDAHKKWNGEDFVDVEPSQTT